MPLLATLLLVAGAGFAASILNVLAGGGSFFTLPLLMALGLPAAEANGTNRIGILAQSTTAVAGFHRAGIIDWRFGLLSAIPATVGAIGGTFTVLLLGDLAFRRVLATLMLAIALVTLAGPSRRANAKPVPSWALIALFLALGFYGGFIQAGMGFLVLAVTTWSGLDLVRGNAVKVLAISLLTVVSTVIFAWSGNVRWDLGLALGVGSAIGGIVGVHVTLRRGQRFLQRVVMTALIVLAIHLWMS